MLSDSNNSKLNTHQMLNIEQNPYSVNTSSRAGTNKFSAAFVMTEHQNQMVSSKSNSRFYSF